MMRAYPASTGAAYYCHRGEHSKCNRFVPLHRTGKPCDCLCHWQNEEPPKQTIDTSGYSTQCLAKSHNHCQRKRLVKKTGELCTCPCHEDP